jgi:hypothetical protein
MSLAFYRWRTKRSAAAPAQNSSRDEVHRIHCAEIWGKPCQEQLNVDFPSLIQGFQNA